MVLDKKYSIFGFKRQLLIILIITLSIFLLASCKRIPNSDEVLTVIENGNTEQLNIYLEKGIDPDAEINGSSPLLIAINNDQIEIVKLLLDDGADANTLYEPDYPIVFYLALNKKTDYLKLFLDHGYDLNFQRQETKSTILFVAINKLNLEWINYLIKLGIDIELRDSDNRTALSHAIHYRKSEAAILLIENGADVNYVCYEGFSIWTDLAFSWNENTKDIVKLASEKGAKINNENTLNGLLAAVLEGNLEFVTWLLEQGADPTIPNSEDKLPIDYAWRSASNPEGPVEPEKEEIVRKIANLLREYGSRGPFSDELPILPLE